MSNQKKKTVVDTVGENGKKLKLAIKPLGHKVLQEAQMVYSVELTSLIKRSVSGEAQLLSRQQLEQHLSDLGIWTENDARQFLHSQLELRSLELKLKKGGIKVSEAKRIALEMKAKRATLLVLYSRRLQFDGITMESMAENKKFKFLIVKCVVIVKNDMLFFASIEDYEARQSEQASVDVAAIVAGQVYGYNQNTETNLAENQWLQQFNLADDQGRLINKDGQLIDIDGRLIDENGRFVNEQGQFVDDKGMLVDKNGNFAIETEPFINDEIVEKT